MSGAIDARPVHVDYLLESLRILKIGQITIAILWISSFGTIFHDDFHCAAFVFIQPVVDRPSGGRTDLAATAT